LATISFETRGLIFPSPTAPDLTSKTVSSPPRNVPSFTDSIVWKIETGLSFSALERMCAPRNDWSASAPIPHTFRSRAASRAPSPQPPATCITTCEPRSICSSAISLQRAWSTKSCE
jgi:hypothetical protein